MTYATLDQITQDVAINLSQAGGVGVQRYAEPRIQLYINQCFKLLLPRQWWPELMTWYTGTLDGTVGVMTSDISNIKHYDDIRAVFVSGSDTPIPRLPLEINPFDIPAGELVFIDAYNDDPDKVFRVWSLTASASLSVHARSRPDTFIGTDTIRFDALVLTYGAAWAYSEDDGTNPGAIQKFQNLFETRLAQLEAMVNSKSVALNARGSLVQSQWWVDR